MSKCKKCNIEIDVPSNICPLCKSEIDYNEEATYPIIKKGLGLQFVRRLVLFILLLIGISVVLINYLIVPKYSWSLFVVLALISTYVIFRSILDGRKKVLRLMFSLNFIVIILSLLWDYFTGAHMWSLNYVLPCLCISYGIFLIVLRFVSYFAFRENSTYIYLNILLEFVPLILLHYEIVRFKPLAVISAIFGLVNLLILIIFDGSKFKDDLIKNFHI